MRRPRERARGSVRAGRPPAPARRPRGWVVVALLGLLVLSGCADASDLAVAADGQPGSTTQSAPDGETDARPDGELDVPPDGERDVRPDGRPETAPETATPAEVGQCRPTPQQVLEQPVDPTQPVDCSEPHTLETFAVVDLPDGADEAQVRRTARTRCRQRLGDYLGRADIAATRISWFYFVTGTDRDDPRLRCDVGLSTTTATGPLDAVTGSLQDVLAGGVPPAQRSCLATPPDPRQVQPLVPCTDPHAAELVPSSKRLGERGSPYPGARRLLAANLDWCRSTVAAKVGDDAVSRVEVPTEAAWRAGLVNATCWAVAPEGTTLPPLGTTI